MNPSSERTQNVGSLLCLYSATFVGSLSYSTILPLLPDLLAAYGKSAAIGGVLASISPLMMLVFGPLLGILSDKFGCRIVLLVTVGGTGVAYLVFGLWTTFVGLVVSRVLAGAMAANVGVVQAGATEQSSSTTRGSVMGHLTSAWALGFVIGPALTAGLAALSKDNIVLLIGISTAVCSVAALVGIGVYYQDSNVKSLRTSDEIEAGSNSMVPTRSYTLTVAHLACLALCQTGLLAMTGFLLQTVFRWRAAQIGLVMFCAALTIVLAQSLIVPRLINLMGEIQTSRVALLVTAFASALIFVADSNRAIVVVSVMLLFTGITTNQTALNTLLSKDVPVSARGLALGSSNAAASIGRIAGPIIFGGLFVISPGAPYLAAFFILLALFPLTMMGGAQLSISVSRRN